MIKIEKEQLKTIELDGDKLKITYNGKVDKTSISEIVLIVKAHSTKTGEEFHYM